MTPPEAVAASLCWLSRQDDSPGRPGLPRAAYQLKADVVARHPGTCDWCDIPLDDLIRMVEDMDPVEASRFGRLSRLDQQRMVRDAQGLVVA